MTRRPRIRREQLDPGEGPLGLLAPEQEGKIFITVTPKMNHLIKIPAE